MGALTPVTTLLTGLTGTLNTIENFSQSVQEFGSSFEDPRHQARRDLKAQQDLALKQLKAQQKLDAAQNARDADLARQKRRAEEQNAEESRQRALRRAVARQRSRFGGAGISSSGGSAEAVLLGLFEETDEDRVQRERIDRVRENALSNDLAQKRSLNVLQAAQMKERQRLERAIRF